MFVRPVIRLDEYAWVEAHLAAFEFFGGVPSRLVPDNLATGVSKADLYDPKINRAYAELASHYGVLVDPARVRKPKDKPRVERPMPYIRDSFWRGPGVAGRGPHARGRPGLVHRGGRSRRHHRSLDGAQPYAVFQAIEAPVLRPLPMAPFELARWSNPKVGTDCHAKVGKVLYSLPWRLIGQRWTPETERTVEFFVDGTLVRTWVRDRQEEADQLGRLPAREGGLLHAHPGVVPEAGL